MNPVTPQSLESERAVLGACIISKEALGSAIEILRPEDFYDPDNRKAYEVLTSMYLSDRPVDFITVSDEFRNKGIFERLGGQSYIAQITGEVTTTANVGYYAGIIHERSVRRRLIEAGRQVMEAAYNSDKSTKEIIETAEKLLYEAAQNKSSSEFRHVRDIISPVFVGIEDRFRQSDDHVAGFPSGFADLDSYTGGLQPGSLIIIAARPSMGKTAFAMNIAQFGGNEQNLPVLVFSLEMPAEQLVLRMLSAESNVDLSRLNAGTFNTSDFDLVREACDVLARRNIFINDDSNLTAMDFRTRCRRFKTRYPDLGLVIVDYLQLMTTGARGNDGRQQEVADISHCRSCRARRRNAPRRNPSFLTLETPELSSRMLM